MISTLKSKAEYEIYQKGKKEVELKFATKLIEKVMDIEAVSEITGLPLGTIQKIINTEEK